jgi:hypothetical protein
MRFDPRAVPVCPHRAARSWLLDQVIGQGFEYLEFARRVGENFSVTSVQSRFSKKCVAHGLSLYRSMAP